MAFCGALSPRLLFRCPKTVLNCQRYRFTAAATPFLSAEPNQADSEQPRTWEQDRILPDGVLQRHNPGEPSTSGRTVGGGGRSAIALPSTAPQTQAAQKRKRTLARTSLTSQLCVPPATQQELDTLADFIQGSRRLVVISGAGCSTESNIPDYRGPAGAYSTGFKPMTHQQFMGSPRTRARYWARSFAGWHDFSRIQPNAAHESLSRLQQRGWIDGVITQNVDRLHHKAGSSNILELHGTTHRVICMSCGEVTHRQNLQEKFLEMNPGAAAAVQQMIDAGRGRERSDSDEMDAIPVVRPDGDVELQDAGKGFRVPPCERCGGVLKPNVVFFGDGIPKHRAAEAMGMAQSCDAMLVVGSSLQVYSAYRLAKSALTAGADVVVLTAGQTRIDPEASYKVEALAGETLARLAAHYSLLIPRAIA